VFKVGDKNITAETLLSLLQRHQAMTQVLRGIVIDEAIADYPCTPEETEKAIAQVEAQYQLTTKEALEAWLVSQNLTSELLAEIAVRPYRLEKFKQATWAGKVESYFLTRKPFLDQVVYSLIRTKDIGLANEIYFRIQEGEQSLSELAQKYSQGVEAKSGGTLGPVPIRQPHPVISQILTISQPGQLWPPRPLAEWFVIVRLEKHVPAQLDDAMRRRLIDEMFETWMAEKLKHMRTIEVINPESEI
jgi:parvulin-like peptidyl-prolyl isomerase